MIPIGPVPLCGTAVVSQARLNPHAMWMKPAKADADPASEAGTVFRACP